MIEIRLSTEPSENTLNINSKYVNTLILGGATVRTEALAETQALVVAVRQAMALYP
jgi:hypothetical protein